MDICACTGHTQLSFSWSGSRNGGGQNACRMTGSGTTEGTFGTHPDLGYRNDLAIPGANSRHDGATDRACRSLTLFKEEMASRNTVLTVRNLKETYSRGSNGAFKIASKTTATHDRSPARERGVCC